MKPITLIGLAFFVLCPSRSVAEEAHRPWLVTTAMPKQAIAALPGTIRVAIARGKTLVTIESDFPLLYVSLAGGKTQRLPAGSTLAFDVSSNHIRLGSSVFDRSVLVSSTRPGSAIRVNGKRFRGALVIRPSGVKTLDVIEQVELDTYLSGVLPKEVGEEWPIESLKAQAVVSRTFVLANLGRFEPQGYDVTNDVMSQVYGGAEAERPKTTQAVQETHGEILVDDDGKPIQAFFHSSCGGKTEEPRYVWRSASKDVPYLQSRKDAFCKEDPYFNWARSISQTALQKKLRSAGYRLGEITKIRIDSRTPSGRVAVFKVYGSSKKTEIRGADFRMLVGADTLRSTKITRIQIHGSQVTFEGQGWGHGVGMCQYGARGRALDGQTYDRIVSFYYPNTNLVKAGS